MSNRRFNKYSKMCDKYAPFSIHNVFITILNLQKYQGCLHRLNRK